jgi:hypothetical protein
VRPAGARAMRTVAAARKAAETRALNGRVMRKASRRVREKSDHTAAANYNGWYR